MTTLGQQSPSKVMHTTSSSPWTLMKEVLTSLRRPRRVRSLCLLTLVLSGWLKSAREVCRAAGGCSLDMCTHRGLVALGCFVFYLPTPRGLSEDNSLSNRNHNTCFRQTANEITGEGKEQSVYLESEMNSSGLHNLLCGDVSTTDPASASDVRRLDCQPSGLADTSLR